MSETMEQMRMKLLTSIRCAIFKYQDKNHKRPDCVMLNRIAYNILTQGFDRLIYQNEDLGAIYGVSIIVTDQFIGTYNEPKFWLCEECEISDNISI